MLPDNKMTAGAVDWRRTPSMSGTNAIIVDAKEGQASGTACPLHPQQGLKRLPPQATPELARTRGRTSIGTNATNTIIDAQQGHHQCVRPLLAACLHVHATQALRCSPTAWQCVWSAWSSCRRTPRRRMPRPADQLALHHCPGCPGQQPAWQVPALHHGHHRPGQQPDWQALALHLHPGQRPV